MTALAAQQCVPNAPALAADAVVALLADVPAWTVADGELVRTLTRTFKLRDYYDTIAFVNALAWMTHQQDHHPELVVTYNTVTMRLTTHSAGGTLTLNDFVCAARADALFAQRAGA